MFYRNIGVAFRGEGGIFFKKKTVVRSHTLICEWLLKGKLYGEFNPA